MTPLFTHYPGLAFHWKAIQSCAQLHALNPHIVGAIVIQESSGNADAFRYEPGFWLRYLARLPEWTAKNPRQVSSSYGLMQIMYPTALDRGFDRTLPPEALFVPDTALEYGCRHFGWLFDRMASKYPQEPTESRLRATLASYNGGFQGPQALRPVNAAYADSVLKLYTQLQREVRL